MKAARPGTHAKSRSPRSIRPEVAAAPAPAERNPFWRYLLLVALTVAVYAPVYSYDFVRFDDPDYVAQNEQVRAGLTWHGVRWAFTTGHIANWHPLTWLSHMLDVQLFGVSPGAHHVVNLVFHVSNTLLLFVVLRRMTGTVGRSMVVAALFAIHPLHVESVAWVSERKDVLSTLFWMLTLLAYVEYVRRQGRLRYAMTLLWFTLGILTKPMVVTLPFVLLLLDVWPLERIALWHGGRLSPTATGRASMLRIASEKLPFLALAAASSVVTVLVQARWGAVGGLTQYPAAVRVMNALVNYIAYVAKVVWPANLSVFYPYRTSISVPLALRAALLLLAITVWSVRASRERPYALVGWLWFVGTLLPVIGIVQAGLQSIADRYTYIPAIGLFVVVSWAGADLAKRWARRREVGAILASVVVGAFAIRAAVQVRTWKDSATLWRHAVDVTTDNAYASYNLGVVLVQAGQTDEGIAQFKEALRIQPDYADVHIDLGNALRGRGALDDAIAQFAIVVKLRPGYAAARVVYAEMLRDRGRPADAIAQYREALKLDPTLAEAHNELGNVLTAEGRHADAMTEYAAAVRLDPRLAEARNNLGGSLVRAGRLEEALGEFMAALRIAPEDATFHYNTALALERLGRTGEALEQLRAALHSDPRHAPSLRALQRLESEGRRG